MTPRLTETIELLGRLVAFDTTSAHSNLPLIDYVEALLTEQGLKCHRVPTEDGQKASLHAVIGPQDRPGIGLSAHTDVVPVAGQAWSSDPFTMVERDGRLYGRGTADMKGYLACVLAMVPMFCAQPLRQPIHLLFSYDEEVGCFGVRPMIAELGERLPAPELVMVGEPTSMRVVDAHKGAARFSTTVTGREAHSSLPHIGVNAIQYAAEFIAGLRSLEAELAEIATDNRFTPAHATLHVGKINGGTAMNIVPKDCVFGWEMRAVPGVMTAHLLQRVAEMTTKVEARMKAVDQDAGIATETMNDIPAFDAGDGSPATALALSMSGENSTDVVSYMTEAALFQAAGFNSVVCGPGDIAQAHAPDEFIEISELAKCLDMLDRLAGWARV